MKTYIAIMVFFCTLIAGTPASAQETGTITGTVTNQASGEALAGVNVGLIGTTQGAATNNSGSYRITGIEAGQYRLKASSVGYTSFTTKIIQINAGQTLTLNISLKETVLKANEIVVTGSKRPEKILQSPATIERVSEEELAKTGGDTFLSSLSNLQGINFTNTGLNTQLVQARGFNSSFNTRMLFLFDGRLATLGGTGLPQGNFLPSSRIDIKSIDVVLGPAAALYGPNAGAGVINVTTKDPWDESGVTVQSRIGNQRQRAFNYRAAGTLNDRFGWKVTGQFKRAIDFRPRRSDSLNFFQPPGAKPTAANTIFETDIPRDYHVGDTKVNGSLYYKQGDFKLTGSYGYSSTSQFSLTGNGRNRIDGWQVDFQTLQLSSTHWYAQATRTGNKAGSYQLNQAVPVVQALFNAGTPVNQFNLEAIRQSLAFIDNTDIYDTEVQYRNTVGGLNLVTGFQYRNFQPESKGTYLDDGNGQDISRELYGGYLQLDYDLIPDRLRIVGAARLDGNTDYDTQFSPKGALVFTAAPGQNIRFTYNRAFTTPTILQSDAFIPVDLSAVAPGYALLIKGNTGGYTIRNNNGDVVNTIDPTVPEEVNSIELGYKGAFGQKAYFNVTGYYSWYKNFIGASSIADGFKTKAFQNGEQVLAPGSSATLLQTFINFGEAKVEGLDAGLDYYFTNNYSISASTSLIKLTDFTNKTTETSLPLNTPPLKFKAGFTARNIFKDETIKAPFLKINGRWRKSYQYISGYWNSDVLLDDDNNINDKAELPSKFQLDASGGFDLAATGLSLKASVSNIFNTDRVDVLGSPPIGRTFWVSLKYKFNGFRF